MSSSSPTTVTRRLDGLVVTTLVVSAYVVAVGLLSADLLSTSLSAALGDGRLPFHLDVDAMDIAGLAARTGELAKAYSIRWIGGVEVRMGYPAGQPMPFSYPPTAALAFAPLSLLSPAVAFLTAQALGLVSFVPAILRLAPRGHRATLLVASLPVACLNFYCGQNAMLLAALTAASTRAWVDRRPGLAGVLSGLATLKPQTALGLPAAMLVARDARGLVAAILTTLLLVGASVVAFGVGPWPAFVGALSLAGEWLAAGYYPLSRFASGYAAAYGLGLRGGWCVAAHAATLVAATAILAAALRRSRDRRVVAGLCTAWGLFVSPYVYDYDLATLVVVAALLAGPLSTRAVGQVRANLLAWAVAAQAMGLFWWTLQGPGGVSCFVLLPLFGVTAWLCVRPELGEDALVGATVPSGA